MVERNVRGNILEDLFSCGSRSKIKKAKMQRLSTPSKDKDHNDTDTANSSHSFIKSHSLEEERSLSLDGDDEDQELDVSLPSSQPVLRSIRSCTPVDLPMSSEMPCCLLEEDEENEMIASSLAAPFRSLAATPIITKPTLATPTTGPASDQYKTDRLSIMTTNPIKTNLHFHRKLHSSISSGHHKKTFLNNRSFKIPIVTPTPVSVISLRTKPSLNPPTIPVLTPVSSVPIPTPVSSVPIPMLTPLSSVPIPTVTPVSSVSIPMLTPISSIPMLTPVSSVPIPKVALVSTVTSVASVSTVPVVPVSTVMRVSTEAPPTIIPPVSSSAASVAVKNQTGVTSISDHSLLLSALNYCSMTSRHKSNNKSKRKRGSEPSSSSSPTQDNLMTSQTRSILRDFLHKQQSSTESQSTTGGKLNGHYLPSASGEVQGNTRKRRKLKSPKPRPPLTSYGAFLRESQSDFTGSSQDVAKKLGLVWGSMNESMKEEYNVKSQVDQYRYTRELKGFLWKKFEDCMEYPVFSRLVDDTIASTGQYNNSELSCSLCHISFCNLYRKNSHFCGRPHSNELVMKLTQVLEESTKERTNDSDGREKDETNSSECLANDSSTDSSSVHEPQSVDHSNSAIVRIDLTGDGDDDDDSGDEKSDLTDNDDDDEEYCNVEGCTAISDDLKPSPGCRPALRDAYQAIGNMEANVQSLELEKSNHLELMNCYIHLLEQESEIQEWSTAYNEAIEESLKQIQTNKESLRRLLELVDQCRARVNDSS
ncbi:PREDICTED: uncharacterized protein LOC105312721 isoform X2 [Amphimedon queenslandica]|uniref:HMG box domain-containing protein n=1 Tax=Amphimedon queenslandica TaxID=400682 RepID=A0A1X7UWG6_AMPQE|nr:PREDICTED: uncharacterized protein LOC105312721 isoform X2 [Amphimedon queenslandica]|eukprot:XP_011403889.1 PREDICTED: uncharacterized protein LOC105312721 isoform X2 [Amphimedon queenslandica]